MLLSIRYVSFIDQSLSLLIFFFSLMTPPTPRSTLFPYTTLFRSSTWPLVTRWISKCSARPVAVDSVSWARDSDRKSTRLNSSHVEISYAVFCLKKKIIINLVHMKCTENKKASTDNQMLCVEIKKL